MEENNQFPYFPGLTINFRSFFFYLITIAAIILIYSEISEFRLLKEIFLSSNFFWLATIILLQVLGYYAMALNYRDVLRVKDLKVDIRRLFPVTFVIQFLNQAVPSATLAGQAFFVQYLKKYGLNLAEGISRAFIELLTLCLAFGLFFFVSVILLFENGSVAAAPQIAFFIYLFLLVGFIFSIIFFSFQKKKRGAVTKWVINKLHRYFEKNKMADHSSHVAMFLDQIRSSFNMQILGRRKKPFFTATLWQGINLFLNALSLYIIALAIGYPISFSVAFITFTLTKFLSMVSFVPGGLGVFEGGMTLVLVSFGVPAQPAFAITLLLRAFTFWFPMPIGWILFRYILHRQELENV